MERKQRWGQRRKVAGVAQGWMGQGAERAPLSLSSINEQLVLDVVSFIYLL